MTFDAIANSIYISKSWKRTLICVHTGLKIKNTAAAVTLTVARLLTTGDVTSSEVVANLSQA